MDHRPQGSGREREWAEGEDCFDVDRWGGRAGGAAWVTGGVAWHSRTVEGIDT
jgi:hypothetical protein